MALLGTDSRPLRLALATAGGHYTRGPQLSGRAFGNIEGVG